MRPPPYMQRRLTERNMTQFFDDMDMSMLVPLDADMVEEALSGSNRSVSELLMLYFACLTNTTDEIAIVDAPERIALAISDMADDGDEDAMMAMVAISTLSSDDAPEQDVIVGVAMLNSVATRPLLRGVISGELDADTAAGALSVINMLSAHLLGDALDLDDIDDLDLDDIDFEELAARLGVSDFDDDVDGELNGR